MYFDSVAQLFAMDGHGVYVWSVYAAALAIIALLALTPVFKRRRFIAEETRVLTRQRNTPTTRLN